MQRSRKPSWWVATTTAMPASRGGEHFGQRRLAGRVQADERLVDEEHGERPDQREHDRGLLAEAAAEARRQVVGPGVEVQEREQLVGRVGPALDAVESGDVLDVLSTLRSSYRAGWSAM